MSPKSRKAMQKLAEGRYLFLERQPYLRSAVYKLAPVEMENMAASVGGSMGVTQSMVLLYDPKVISEEWDTEDVASGLAHEVGHIMRDHLGRGKLLGVLPGSKDAMLLNYAGDALIARDLVAAGFKLMDTDVTFKSLGLDPDKFNSLEAVFAELKRTGFKVPRFKCCGSGSGHAFKGEDTTLPANHPAHRPDSDIDRTRREVAEAINNHIKTNGRGSVPGGWMDWAGIVLEPPKVSWSQKLARKGRRIVASKQGYVDYSYGGMSHLQGGLGYGPGVPILPVMVGSDVEVVLALDTSGSMAEAEITRAVSESSAIMKAAGTRVRLLACDCVVHTSKEVKTVAELLGALHGGGGTSFVPVFEEIAKWKKKPDLLIFATDGGGDAPASDPGYPVIWLLVGEHKCEPSFGGWNAAGKPFGEMVWVD